MMLFQKIYLNPYWEVILAGIIWGSSGFFIKYLALPTTTVTFFRLAVPTILLFIFLTIKKIKLFQGNNRLIILASTLNAGRIFLYIVGFTFASIGNAVIILYTWPIFATFFAMIFLQEKVHTRNFSLIFIALTGVALIYFQKEFSFSDNNFLGMTAMLFSAAIYALTIIIFKKESEKYSTYETVFYQNVVGAIVFLPFIFFNKPFPTLFQTNQAVGYAVLIGIIGYALFFSALKRINASSAAFLSYIEVVSAILLGVIFFQEQLTWNMVLGGSMILVAATLIIKEK